MRGKAAGLIVLTVSTEDSEILGEGVTLIGLLETEEGLVVR